MQMERGAGASKGSLAGWLILALVVALIFAAHQAAQAGNFRLLLAEMILLAAIMAYFARIGRKYRQTHPEYAARMAAARDTAILKSDGQMRSRLRIKLRGTFAAVVLGLSFVALRDWPAKDGTSRLTPAKPSSRLLC